MEKVKLLQMTIFNPFSTGNTYTDVVLLKYFLLFQTYNKETT